MSTSKLDQVVGRCATNLIIESREAPAIVRAAKESGSKKPIDDVFKAIDRADVSIDEKATRFICANLDQKMSRAKWVAYVQKCASMRGEWAPGDAGMTKVSPDELPLALKKIYDRWQSTTGETTTAVRFEVAGKPAFLIEQNSEFGMGVGLFDEAGHSIKLKEDTKNVERETKRIQGAYDKWFCSPALHAWKASIDHTDIGIMRDYSQSGTLLEGKELAAAMSAEVKRVATEIERLLKKGPEIRLYRNNEDGSLLLVGSGSCTGPEHFALFSEQGRLLERFVIDV